MNIFVARQLIAIQFLLIVSGAVFAQPQLAQIRGRVVDAQTNQPVSNAIVKIRHVPIQVLSDSTGRFRLNQVPLGLVEFQVSKGGYEVNSTSVQVSPKAYEIDVKLIRKSKPTSDWSGIEPYQERAYLSTDKPYYYPGEIIWMKAFVQYYDATKRDSLSRVVFVDLIDGRKKVLQSLTLSVDSGRWQASLLLPKELAPGSYALRVYTRFLLNFNDPDRIFTKLVPVLAQNQRIDNRGAAPPTADSSHIIVTPARIGTRSKVTVSFRPEQLMAELSAAVTDATQVRAIPEVNIQDALGTPWQSVDDFEPRFIVDKGVCFSGSVTPETGRPRKVAMTIYRDNFKEVLDFETDDQGIFTINGVKFYDSATWYYQSKGKKGKANFGTVKINRWVQPDPDPVPGFWFRVETTESAQRVLPDYLIPPEARLLDEVVVKSTRLEDETKTRGILGGADQTVDVTKLPNTGNLLLALQGKVIGLTINCALSECQVYFNRAVGNSITGSIEPLVLINNAPAFGTAGQILSQLDINQVERIEFSRRINVLYGEQGRNGIISVYLKSGVTIGEQDSGIRSFKMNGLHKPLHFFSPTYSDPDAGSAGADYRSTIYWNPELVADEAGTYGFEFYTSDLPGPYRVTVEGLTKTGKPVRHVTYFEVVDR